MFHAPINFDGLAYTGVCLMRLRRAVVLVAVAAAAAAQLTVPAAQAAPVPAAPKECAASRPDGRSATAAAADCGGKVEILAERTETSQTFANPDGSRTLEQSIQPEWVRRGSGWVPVDTTLRKGAGGVVVPGATVLPMTFSPGGTRPLAELRDGDQKLAMTWPDKLPTPTLTGDTAVYAEVLPGVDLRVTATALGFSEVLVVKSPKAAQQPGIATVRFGLKATGVTVAAKPDGGLEARDKAGRPVFVAPTPLMWDSSGEGEGATRDGADVATPGRRAVMPATVSGGQLTLKPDRKLLTDPGTKYPVYIDPSWTGGIASNAWTTVWSKFPSSKFWQNSTALQNGADKGSAGAGLTRDCDGCATHKVRTFFRMNTSAVKGKVILGAKFRIEQRWSWTCSPKSNAKVWLTGGISSSTTWNNQPSWDNNYTSQTAASRKVGAVHGCAGPGTIEFDLKTIVTRAAAGKWNDVTLGLRAIDEGTTNHWKRYNHASPKLAIDYNTIPNAPGQRWSDGKVCATGAARPYVLTLTPILAAKHSDADTGQQALTTFFYWWQLGGARNETDKISQASGNPATPSKAIPAGKIVDGRTYVWQARTYDGSHYSAWSGTCEFTADVTPPNTPNPPTSSDYPPDSTTEPAHGGVGLPGTFQLNPPTTKPEEVVGYAYTLDSGVQPSAATQVAANATTHAASVSITPLRDGVNTLRVWTKDPAGRYSATPREYKFKVRSGNGPAAEWVFDEASGNATDDTGHNNTATLGGGASRTPGRAGVGSALSLNGTTAYAATTGQVVLPHPDTPNVTVPVTSGGSTTVTAWVRLTATGGGVRNVASYDGANVHALRLAYNGANNTWIFRTVPSDTSGAAGATIASTSTAVAGRWTHLAAVWDLANRQMKLYVNGTLEATYQAGSNWAPHNAATSFSIGRTRAAAAYSEFWSGAIDDVRVYNYPVAADKIALLAVPLAPVLSFPNGDSVTAGQPINVRIDSGGDANITSYKYSVGSAILDKTVAVTAGAAATVAVPTTASMAGQQRVFAITVDAKGRQSLVTAGTFTVIGAAKISGSVIDIDTSELVAGALVTLSPGNHSMTTAANGWYSFAGIAPGTYTIKASIGGRCGKSFEAQLAIEGDMTVDLPLMQLTDGLGYTCQVAAAAFVAADQTVVPLTGDDAVTKVNIPFAFPFYGHAYREAWIDTNGLLSFTDPAGSHRYPGGNLPAPAQPNAAVAAFWDDLVVDASASVRTAIVGTGADQRFVIEWRNVHRKASTAQRLTAEAVLAPDGTIELNYAGLDNDAEKGAGAAVGIEGPEGEDGLLYSASQPVLVAGQEVTFDHPGEAPIDRFALSGTVRDSAGAAVSGATVTLDPAGLTAPTAPNGTWGFTGLVANSYTVPAATGGRCARTGSAQVELTGGDAVHDLVVRPVGDGFGYGCAAAPRPFVPAANVIEELKGDYDAQHVTLPFPFRLYGRDYSSTTVITDGTLIFAGPVGDAWDNKPLPTADAPNAALYAFQDDLVIDQDASVRTELFGTAPNRYFVVEWRNALIFDTTGRLTFEMVLYENGDVAFNYAGLDTPLERGGSATVGIESHAGTTALQYSANEDALVNGTGILFTPPPAGTIQGTVTAAGTGTAVAGATVTLRPGNATTTTGADGSYQFTGVKSGDYTVSVARGDGKCAGPEAAALAQPRGGVDKIDLSVGTGSDGYGNSCTVGPRTLLPTDTVLGLTGDDAFTQVTLPFPVTLYGTTYNTAWVDTNGVVTFELPEGPSWNVSEIPSAVEAHKPNAAVYAFWEDWDVDADASMRTAVSGTAPNRKYVVEWHNVVAWKDRTQRATFQVVFEEAGDIAVAWDGIDQELIEQGLYGVVGIENSEGSEALVHSSFVPALRSGTGVVFHRGDGVVGTVTGTVTCAGAAVSGASVVSGTHTATTNASGQYTLPNVPVGPAVVIATATGGGCAGSGAAQVTVAGETSVTGDIAMTSVTGGGYSFTSGPRSFLPAEQTTLALTGDDEFVEVTLPFPITLYGQAYSTAWVDTNGVVSFTPPDGSAWNVSPIPSAAEPHRPNAAVYPFWDDWVVDDEASVRTAMAGTGPNRTFVVEWRNVTNWADRTARVTFQVVFAENGEISFAWKDVAARSVERGGKATVGVENAAGSKAHQYLHQHPVIRSGEGLLLRPVVA
ncbi:carboxypeptidase regulatory-like domain-containing protein [Micromonospora sp. CPCC 205371]|nr:carboxypeptidase regulatory-like domain-containing protein [Micromonospora sp. CPCC 205371]